MTGSSIPTTNTKVTLGGVICDIESQNGSTTVCTLRTGAPAGSHHAKLISDLGLIPNVATAIDIALVVSSVTPDSNLNYLGGDVLTLSGSGFSSDISIVSVIVDDTNECLIS